MVAMQPSNDGDGFDVVIIGAGLSGLVAAARYLEAHPDSNLAILEQDYCVGGVWSERRIYPGFWSQSAYGIAEFADMPMERPPAEDFMNNMFKAKYTMKYIEDYADNRKFAGRSLRDRVQFNTNVKSVEKVDSRWQLSCTMSKEGGTQKDIFAARLMVANGQASTPRMPDLPGKEKFAGLIMHSVDWGQADVLTNEKIKHVIVLGGGKSAADMVYESAKAGKTVSWIIRKTGPESTGPGFFAPPDVPVPGYENPGLAAQSRVMSSLQPTFLNQDTWWTRFLHGTNFGVSLVKSIFGQADAQLQKRARYKERGLEKLKYEVELFWQNGTGGVLHHADFFDVVAEKVTVHRASVKALLDNELYLDDGTHFPCDAVLCGTGWKRGLDIFSRDLLIQLGLPYPKEHESQETAAKWEKLVKEADDKVLAKYLILRNPPPHPHVYETRTPYRLYKGMAPLHDDTVLFINHITVANKLFGAEAQAMWAVAFFDHHIKLPSHAERERDISTWIAWCRRRYLSNGELGNCVAFDGVPYVDSLLDEMGVTAHRQKGWLRNFFAPFRPADLGKTWAEYLSVHSK